MVRAHVCYHKHKQGDLLSTLLFTRLQELTIEHKTYYHKPVFTCQEADLEYDQLPPFGRCKNLFLKDSKKQLWLIIALAATPIKLKEFAKNLQAPELRFAGPELLLQYLGVQPGSVTPFGLIHDEQHVIRVVLEQALLNEHLLGFHPLSNDATTLITPDSLRAFIAACGNELRVLDATRASFV